MENGILLSILNSGVFTPSFSPSSQMHPDVQKAGRPPAKGPGQQLLPVKRYRKRRWNCCWQRLQEHWHFIPYIVYPPIMLVKVIEFL